MAKIMIVDDEIGIRKVVSEFLSEEGMDVVAACDGSECSYQDWTESICCTIDYNLNNI